MEPKHINLPLPRRPVGEGIFLTIALLITVGVSWLAAENLATQHTGLLGQFASGFWLGLVVLVLSFNITEHGLRSFLVLTLGTFVRTHQLWLEAQEDNPPLLTYGYRCFGRRFIILQLPADGILWLRMGSGQATAMAGKDMNDWQVSVWFDPDAAARKPTRRPTPPDSQQDICVLGYTGPKDIVETFFTQLREAFTQLGLPLAADEEDRWKPPTPTHSID